MPSQTIILALALAACARVQAAEPSDAGTPDAGPPIDAAGNFTQFTHRVHVTDNLIGCSTCHPHARHSPVAGIISMAGCMGCHKFAGKDKPSVQALAVEAAAGRPLRFLRVFRQPDHVYFSHERHLARELRCAECHGDVAHMAQDVSVKDMNMGFCMECHRDRQASIDCLTCHK